MILLGHEYIPHKPFHLIIKKEDIEKTPPNSTVVFEFSDANVALCHYCRENGLKFALIADKAKDVLFANALGSGFIITDKSLAEKAQKYADEYMFDAKILVYGEEVDLEWAADLAIDGVMFEKGIDYGSC